MSYETWEDSGYGIISSEIKTTPERIKNLLDLAPKYKKKLEDYLEELEIPLDEFYEDPESVWDDFSGEYPDDGYGNSYNMSLVTVFLKNVILEKENIFLSSYDDFDADEYLLLLPFYPWSDRTLEEKALTKEKFDEIFLKYISVIAENSGSSVLNMDYYTCKNGG